MLPLRALPDKKTAKPGNFMEQINLSHAFILLIQCVLTSGVLLFLFRLRSVMGIGLLFAALGVFQYMQVFLANTLYYEVYPGIVISPGSSVLFSVNLFMVLLIYIREDAKILRTLIYALVAANLILSLLQYTFGYHIESALIINPYNLPADLFIINARVLFVGTALLFIDAILVVLLFEYISKISSSLFFRIFATMAIVLMFDSVVFSIGGFAGTEQFKGILISGLVSKLIATILYTIIFTAYLHLFEKRVSTDRSATFKDVFYLLTYRQKFERALLEKEQQQLAANQALKESKEFLQNAINSVHDGISVLSIDGEHVSVNPALCKMTGFSQDELVGSGPPHLYWPEEELPNIGKAFEKTKAGYAGNHELVFKRKNGERFPVIVSPSPIKDEKGNIINFIATLKDISSRKKTELALLESENRFRALYEHSPDLLVSVSPQGGLIQLCNNTFLETTGYRKAEVIGFPIFNFYHPTCRPAVKNAFEQFVKTGSIRNQEVIVVKKDGSTLDANLHADAIRDESGKILYSISSLRDITWTKQLDGWKTLNTTILEKTTKGRPLTEVLSEITLGIDQLIPHASSSVMLVNEKNQLVSAANSRLPASWIRIIDPMEVKPDAAPFGRAVYYQKRIITADVTKDVLCTDFRDAALQHGYSACWSEPILGSDNKTALGAFGMYFSEPRHPSDYELKLIKSVTNLLSIIIEKTNAELELVNYKDHLEELVQSRTSELEEANRELESFSYSVSHDLRAPLTRLDGFSRVLQKSYADKLDEKGIHYLSRIRASSQNMASLIDDMLQLSKITRQEVIKETIDIGQLSQEIMTQLQESQPDRKLALKIHPYLAAKMDPVLARLMLENLLQNAWKFTQKQALASIEIGEIDRAGNTWFFVKDNGIGFDMKYYEQLFKPFQRLHSSAEVEGTGIGLATVKRIIKKHGGQIEATAFPDKGATFFFKL